MLPREAIYNWTVYTLVSELNVTKFSHTITMTTLTVLINPLPPTLMACK